MFGYGWITNYEMLLVDSGYGPITLIDGDATRHIFGQKVGGGYVAHGGVYLDLVKNSDGTYTITKMDGTKFNFTTGGKLSSIVDTNENTLTLTYNTSGKLVSTKDASGRTTTISYGTNGYVSSIVDPANRTVGYGYDTAGNLTKVSDAAGSDTTFGYDADHNLISITNARNVKTTVNYDASDRVSSITQPITIDGVTTTSTTNYVYDTEKMVTSVTDGEGKRVDYSYNANKNVVQITENPLATDKAVTTFSYDNNNNLTKIVDPNTNKANGTEAYIYTYDAKGNITGVQLPENQLAAYNYDSRNNLVKETDFNSNVSTFDYDSKNNQMESIDPNVQSVSQRYFSNGNLQYFTHPMSVADNKVLNSSFELDANADNWPDNWTQKTEGGSTATFAWSTTAKFSNKAISIANPTGLAEVVSDMIPYTSGDRFVLSSYIKTASTSNTIVFKLEFFDSSDVKLGEKLASSLKGTHDWTRVQTVIDSIPANTAKVRVSLGLNSGSGTAYFDGIQLEKGTVLSAYNLIDNSSFERNTGAGDKTPYGWSNSGNLSTNDGIDQNVNAGDDKVYAGKYSFKLTGEKTKNKFVKQRLNVNGDANSRFTLSGWSKQEGADLNGGYYNLQVAINHTDGTTDWSNANDFSKTTTGWQHVAAEVKPTKAFNSIDVYYYYYDQLGTAWFDAMRLEVGSSHAANSYDVNGNYLTSVKDPIGNITSSVYDSVGNRTSVTDGKGQETSFEFDAENRLTKVTDTNLGVTSYGYDGEGNRTTITDAKNNVTTYGYNEFNVISSIINPLNQTTQFGYDKNGNNTAIVFPKGDEVSYTYNALNRLDSIYYNGLKKWGLAYDANGNVTSVADAAGTTTSYTYDKNDRITQKAEGTSNKMDYAYDSNNNLTSLIITAGTATISTGFSYNPLDQLVGLSRDGVNQARFVYDERGNVISISRSNDTYTSIEYDDANRLKAVKNYNISGALLDTYEYSYDANNNITSIVTNAGTISYQYDVLNQLTQETLTDGMIIAYKYDAVGNRTEKTVTNGTTTTTTTYTYDAANQLTAVNGQSYSYDANGNLTGNGAKTFVYNEENRLIEVKDSTGVSIAKFTYDHEGKRTSKTNSSGTVYFHYSGKKVIYETDANNKIVVEYTWDALGKPISMIKGGTTYYYHVNGHGDVTTLTDVNGAVVAEYKYDAWGNIISQTGTLASENPYRYAGYRYDQSTELYYLVSRYYDSDIGRFLTMDTFQGFEDEPLGLNKYAYVKNNPVMYIDPDGHYASIVYWALRYLITKVGYTLAKKAWAIAQPYIKKGITEANKYDIDGPGGGGRIIQVRYKGGSPIFRLDWYPVTTGGPYRLHYHVPPNLKTHHIIW
jgi:RHS repeat-associated protein